MSEPPRPTPEPRPEPQPMIALQLTARQRGPLGLVVLIYRGYRADPPFEGVLTSSICLN